MPMDAGGALDINVPVDAVSVVKADVPADADGPEKEAVARDAGDAVTAEGPVDVGSVMKAGVAVDVGSVMKASVPVPASSPVEAAVAVDAGSVMKASVPVAAGSPVKAAVAVAGGSAGDAAVVLNAGGAVTAGANATINFAAGADAGLVDTGHGADAAMPLLGQVRALYLRDAAGTAPRAVAQVLACAGSGFEGDVQRDALSPRQLLVAGTPAYARLDLPANALRENLLLDVDSARLASGQLLAIGARAVIRLTFACEPCARLNLRQMALSRQIGAQRGMLARVLHGGVVRVGDPVRLLPARQAPWPDHWRTRVEMVLARVPPGMVVEYRQLALLAGVALTYCRVFPRVARELGLAHKAVPLRSRDGAGQATLPRWQGDGLFDDPAIPPDRAPLAAGA